MSVLKKKYFADHYATYAFAARYVGGTNVLELGSGEGYGAQMLSAFTPSYKGADFDRRFLSKAAMKQLYCPSEFIHLDFEKDPVPLEGIDWVVAFEVLEHINNPEQVLKQIADAGKRVVFSVPHDAPHALHKRDFYSLDDAKALVPPNMHVEWFLFRKGFWAIPGDFKIPERYVGVGIPVPALSTTTS